MNDVQKKELLRGKMKKRRNALGQELIDRAGTIIEQKFLCLPEVQSARVIFIYVSYANEVPTHSLIKKLLSGGKIVCVPRVISEEKMVAVQIYSLKPRAKTPFRGAIDLCVAPGLAFDAQGNRLGMGGGFYDRFFADCSVGCAIGLAYEWQIIDNVPHENHDKPLNIVCSDQKIHRMDKK